MQSGRGHDGPLAARSLSRPLAEAMGVRSEMRSGEGSTFTVVVQLPDKEEPAAPAVLGAGHASRGEAAAVPGSIPKTVVFIIRPSVTAGTAR